MPRRARARPSSATGPPARARRPYDLTGEADGAYTFRVRATDAAGNTGPSASRDYTLDRDRPGCARRSPRARRATRRTTRRPTRGRPRPARRASAASSAAATVVSDWAACTDPRSYDLSAEPDGAYTLPRPRDGRRPATPGPAPTRAYTLDRTAPAAPDDHGRPAGRVAGRHAVVRLHGARRARRPSAGSSAARRWSSGWAACTSPNALRHLAARPTAPTRSRVRATDAAGNTGPGRHARRTRSTATRRPRPSITSAARRPTRRTTRPRTASRREAGAATRVPHRARRHGRRRLGARARPDGLRPLGRARRRLHVPRPRDRRRRQHRPGGARAPTRSTAPRPAAPVDRRRRRRPSSPDDTPTYGFTGEAGAAFECRIERGATVVDDWAACTRPDDLRPRRRARRRLHVPRPRDRRGRQHRPGGRATLHARPHRAGRAGDHERARPPTRRDDTPVVRLHGGGRVDDRVPPRARRDRGRRTGALREPGRRSISSAEVDGAYTFSVRATDAAGNTGAGGHARPTRSTAPTPAAPDRSPAARRPTRRTTRPTYGVHRRGRRGVRVPARARRDRRRRLGRVHRPARRSTSRPRPTAPTPSASARPTPRATRAPPATRSYTLDRTAPGRADDHRRAGRRLARTTRPTFGWTGEAGAAIECRIERGGTVVDDWTPCTEATACSVVSSVGPWARRRRSEAGDIPDNGALLRVRWETVLMYS